MQTLTWKDVGKSKAVTLLGLILAVNDKVKVVNLSLKKALKQTKIYKK